MSDSSVTPCTVALSMRFPRQEYWSGLPFPSPVDLPNPGIEPMSLELQADSFYHRATRKKDCSGLYSVSRNLFIMYHIIPPHLSSVLSFLFPHPQFWELLWMQVGNT